MVTTKSPTTEPRPIGFSSDQRKHVRDIELGQQTNTPRLFDHPTPPPAPCRAEDQFRTTAGQLS